MCSIFEHVGSSFYEAKRKRWKGKTSIASHFMWLPILGHIGDVASIAGALRLELAYRKNAFLSAHEFESQPACYKP